jgi:uracil-DNA glycosylase
MRSVRPVPPPPPARVQALAFLEWARGSGGRFSFVDTPVPPAVPAQATSPATIPAAPSNPASLSASASPDPFDALREEALVCRRCRLCETRQTVVFGEGPRRPRLMVVGEAPGQEEDATGRPFVGKAGQLLTKMLAAIGLRREDVYIANVLKCRPPGNRPPQPDEVAACRPYLLEQARLLEPDLVLVLGNHAAKALLQTDRGISSIRGRIVTSPEGLRCLPSFHPSYLLRTPEAKREAWLDLQLAAKTLGLPVVARPTP